MLTLRAEIAACLFAVALLGLLSGWMMQRARSHERLRRTVSDLEARHEAAEESLRRDAENLEEQLQSLGEQLRATSAENRTLRERAGGEEETLDTARTEAIELNRRQIESQERLQRIIREREREIATLRAGLAGRAAGDLIPANDDHAPPPEGLDETVRIDPALLPTALAVRAASNEGRDGDEPPHDDTLESTVDVAFLDAEEATVALDEETLSLVRGLAHNKRER